MNKNKTYPDEYKLTKALWITIPLWVMLGILIYLCLECDWQRDWLALCLLSVFCLWYLYLILQYIEYAIFSHKGVLIVHTKRWGKNRTKQEFYIDWKDVKYIKFNILITGDLSPTAIDIVSRILGHGYDQPTCLPYGKFASLAIYYSERKDIIYTKRKKPGLYEKDW